MKTKFLVLILATVIMSSCGGGSASKSSCSHGEAGCCSEGHSCAAECAANAQKTIIAQIFIKPEHVDAFLAATKDLIAKSRAEEGCITYNLYQDPSDGTKLLFFEEWKNQAAIDFHFETEHFKAFGKMLEEFASADPVITIL